VSDVILSSAKKNGVNPLITIYRPGMISSSTLTGHSNLTDFNNRFIKAIVELKCFPEIDAMLGNAVFVANR
jgi:thioester reductase-like protein